MRHCYIFDYNTGEIYHCEVPEIDCTDDILNIWIFNNYGYKLHSDTHYMIVDNELEIKDLKI